MTDPLPSTQTPPGEVLAYQPISLWALVGFVLGCLFAALVSICAVVGLIQGAPVFFPTYLVAIAGVGVVLSWLGLRHVQLSEGTRAGAKLARFGLWLSLISGLSYYSYYFFTGEALIGQANAFVLDKTDPDSGFLPRIIEGGTNPVELNRAFLLTLAPSSRTGRPEDEGSMRKGHDIWPTDNDAVSPLVAFRQSRLVRILANHPEAEIKPLAVLEWKYDKRSYQVQRRYLIKTKEVEVEALLTAYSVEPEASGQSRKWFINLAWSDILEKTTKMTPLGAGLVKLRARAIESLKKQYAAMIKDGKSLGHFKDDTDWSVMALPERIKEEQIKEAFAPAERVRNNQLGIHTPPDALGKWEIVDGRIRIELWFRCEITIGPGLLATVDGDATLETTVPVDPENFSETETPIDWRIARIVFSSVRAVQTAPR
jgi:hypothetical protein